MGRNRAILVAGLLVLWAGCPTVDLGDNPPEPGVCRPDIGYYRDVIWPELLAPADPVRSCVAQGGCHQIDSGRSALRLTTDPVDHNANYAVVSRFLNCGTPSASSLITKPVTEVDPHGGGDMFPMSDPVVTDVFLGWFGP